jgi:hypothetical protein
MIIERSEVEAEFYKKCAEILDVDYTYKKRYLKKTRWNNRDPGNGRFPGHGLIRYYSGDNIHIILTKPVIINKICKSADEVLLLLKTNVKENKYMSDHFTRKASTDKELKEVEHSNIRFIIVIVSVLLFLLYWYSK